MDDVEPEVGVWMVTMVLCICVYVYVLDKGERSGGVDSIVY
jgi:hypothetical protein